MQVPMYVIRLNSRIFDRSVIKALRVETIISH